MMSLMYVLMVVILVILFIAVIGIVSAIRDEIRQSDKMRAKRKDVMQR